MAGSCQVDGTVNGAIRSSIPTLAPTGPTKDGWACFSSDPASNVVAYAHCCR